MLFSAVKIRPYALSDLESCLSIFDRNTPKYFAPSDRRGFSTFLGNLPDPYLVGEREGRGVIACGGWYLKEAEAAAGLSWGMVDPSVQGKGFGRILLAERIRQIREDGRAQIIKLRTTPLVQGFFERAGFKATRTMANGLGLGFDLVEMELHP
jgi:GNAT superfamily N-acetyltransferase